MQKKHTLQITSLTSALLILCMLLSGCELELQWGYSAEVSEEERQARDLFVATAAEWLGRNSLDGSHKEIIDIYNAHEPLAVSYVVQYTDKWCATFVSTVSIQCGYTDIIPTECGCQRQIDLFAKLARWEENDDYIPLPGDIIYYCSDSEQYSRDNTGWSDHVGIVVGTNSNRIRVIEGNMMGSVSYRTLNIGAPEIRGYALPDYASLSNEKLPVD